MYPRVKELTRGVRGTRRIWSGSPSQGVKEVRLGTNLRGWECCLLGLGHHSNISSRLGTRLLLASAFHRCLASDSTDLIVSALLDEGPIKHGVTVHVSVTSLLAEIKYLAPKFEG